MLHHLHLLTFKSVTATFMKFCLIFHVGENIKPSMKQLCFSVVAELISKGLIGSLQVRRFLIGFLFLLMFSNWQFAGENTFELEKIKYFIRLISFFKVFFFVDRISSFFITLFIRYLTCILATDLWIKSCWNFSSL